MKYKNSKVIYLGLGISFLNMGKSHKDSVQINPYEDDFSIQKHGFLGLDKRILDSGELGFDPNFSNSTSNSTNLVIDPNQVLDWSQETHFNTSLNQSNGTSLSGSQNQTNSTSVLGSQDQGNQGARNSTNHGLNGFLNISTKINDTDSLGQVQLSQVPTGDNSTQAFNISLNETGQNFTATITINNPGISLNTTNQTMGGTNSITSKSNILGGNIIDTSSNSSVSLFNPNNPNNQTFARLLNSSAWQSCNFSEKLAQRSFSYSDIESIDCNLLRKYTLTVFILAFFFYEVNACLVFFLFLQREMKKFFCFPCGGKWIDIQKLLLDLKNSSSKTKIMEIKEKKIEYAADSEESGDFLYEYENKNEQGAKTLSEILSEFVRNLNAEKQRTAKILKIKVQNEDFFELKTEIKFQKQGEEIEITYIANSTDRQDKPTKLGFLGNFKKIINRQYIDQKVALKEDFQKMALIQLLDRIRTMCEFKGESITIKREQVLGDKRKIFVNEEEKTDLELTCAFQQVSDLLLNGKTERTERVLKNLSQINLPLVFLCSIMVFLSELYNILITDNRCIDFQEGNYSSLGKGLYGTSLASLCVSPLMLILTILPTFLKQKENNMMLALSFLQEWSAIYFFIVGILFYSNVI